MQVDVAVARLSDALEADEDPNLQELQVCLTASCFQGLAGAGPASHSSSYITGSQSNDLSVHILLPTRQSSYFCCRPLQGHFPGQLHSAAAAADKALRVQLERACQSLQAVAHAAAVVLSHNPKAPPEPLQACAAKLHDHALLVTRAFPATLPLSSCWTYAVVSTRDKPADWVCTWIVTHCTCKCLHCYQQVMLSLHLDLIKVICLSVESLMYMCESNCPGVASLCPF